MYAGFTHVDPAIHTFGGLAVLGVPVITVVSLSPRPVMYHRSAPNSVFPLFSLLCGALCIVPVPGNPPRMSRVALPRPSLTEPVRLDSVLSEIVEKSGTPGMAAVVMSGDTVIGRGVAGVRVAGRGDRIRDDDLFHVGSALKPMTMTMLATLVDEGVLSWDLTVASVFPDMAASMRAEYRDVTLRELITHRSGMPALTSGAEVARLGRVTGSSEGEMRMTAVRSILALPPAKPRGEYLYSNAGIVTAAAIAERVTGRAYPELMAARVFMPLHMASAGAGWPVVRDSTQPWGHRGRAGALTPTGPADPYRLQSFMNPAGNISMSAGDLARFATAQLHLFRNEPSLTRAATLRWRFLPSSGTPHPETSIEVLDTDGTPAAFGEPGDSVWTDDGSAGTFLARVLVDPVANISIAIAANSLADDAVDAAQQKLFAWARRRVPLAYAGGASARSPRASGAPVKTPASARLDELLDVIRSQSGARAKAFVDAMSPTARAGNGESALMSLLERLTDAHGALDVVRVDSSSASSITAVARGARGGGERIVILVEPAAPFRVTSLKAEPVAIP